MTFITVTSMTLFLTKTLHYALQNTGHLGQFVIFLEYKATQIGKYVIALNEWGFLRYKANYQTKVSLLSQ